MTLNLEICTCISFEAILTLTHYLHDLVKETVSSQAMSATRILLDDDYFNMLIRQLKSHPVDDGIIDTCRTLLQEYSQGDKEMLKMILSPQNFN
jgi:ERCC4-related helicase